MGGMPAVRMDERLFNLVLALLSTRQGITKADIFAHVRGYTDADAGSSVEARERLFERDKRFLRSFGVAIEVEDDPALSDNQSQRYRIVPEAYELPADVTFTPEELRMMVLAGTVWRHGVLSEPAQVALTKLRGLGAELHGAEFPVTIVVNEQNVDALTRAAAKHDVVRFRYRAAGYEEPVVREAVALHLFLHRGRWHLYAWDPHRDVFRTYLVSRIVGAVESGRRHSGPIPEVQVDAVRAELEAIWQRCAAILQVREHSEADTRLRRRATAADQDVLTVHYIDEALFADELCSYGDDVVVVKPESLRQRVIAALRKLAGEGGDDQ